jgi:hypothetical protein
VDRLRAEQIAPQKARRGGEAKELERQRTKDEGRKYHHFRPSSFMFGGRLMDNKQPIL